MPLQIDEAASYTPRGDDTQLPIRPAGGTLDISANTVVIAYEQDGVSHEVVYEVLANP